MKVTITPDAIVVERLQRKRPQPRNDSTCRTVADEHCALALLQIAQQIHALTRRGSEAMPSPSVSIFTDPPSPLTTRCVIVTPQKTVYWPHHPERVHGDARIYWNWALAALDELTWAQRRLAEELHKSTLFYHTGEPTDSIALGD